MACTEKDEVGGTPAEGGVATVWLGEAPRDMYWRGAGTSGC